MSSVFCFLSSVFCYLYVILTHRHAFSKFISVTLVSAKARAVVGSAFEGKPFIDKGLANREQSE